MPVRILSSDTYNYKIVGDIPVGKLCSFCYGSRGHIAIRYINGLVSLTDPSKIWSNAEKLDDLREFSLLPKNTMVEYCYEQQ